MSLPIITADDWGMSPGINEGILDLARRGIVRRVSILATAAFVRHQLVELKRLSGLSLGLHFSLTFGETCLGDQVTLLATGGKFHLPPTRVALLFLVSNREKRERLVKEIILLLREQLGVLESFEIQPRHLDGHHHIHLVPGLMKLILPVLREIGVTQVRLPWDPGRLLSRVGPIVLLSLWARPMWKRWGLKSLPCIYPSGEDYGSMDRLHHILSRKGGHEVVVHPAARDDVSELKIPDNYAGDRVCEYQTLQSLEPLFSHS